MCRLFRGFSFLIRLIRLVSGIRWLFFMVIIMVGGRIVVGLIWCRLIDLDSCR